MPRFRQIALIAERDFWATVLTKSFLLAILAFPIVAAIMPAMMVLAVLKPTYRIALIDSTGAYYPAITEKMRAQQARMPSIEDLQKAATPGAASMEFAASSGGRYEFIDLLRASGIPPESATAEQLATTKAQALQRIQGKEFFAVVEVAPTDEDEEFQISFASLSDSGPKTMLGELLTTIVRERRAAKLGIDKPTLERILTPPDIPAYRVTAEAETEKASAADFVVAFLLPIMLVFGLYGLVSFMAERLLTALIEEKLKRLLEVILTRASIYELLIGKMLGVLYVGSIFYVGAGVLFIGALHLVGFGSFASAYNIFFYTLFFIAGFGLYASFYSAIGAACANPKDAENFAMPLRMVLMIPIIVSVYVNNQPESPASVFFSYFPLTAPFVMVNRMFVTDVGLLGLAASLAIIIATTALALWGAVRIFRASLVSSDESLSWGEIFQGLLGRNPAR